MISTKKASQLILKLVKLLHKNKGSDILINANSNPALKIDGEIEYIKDILFNADETETIARALMTESQYTKFNQDGESRLILEYSGFGYFRTTVFRQRGEIGLAMRLISFNIPNIEELRLPDIIKDIALAKSGLVLVSGLADTGKSSTLATMLDYRNNNKADHIITIEDSIEFIHKNKRSMITQREVGIDTASYAVGLKAALRQSPNLIFIGEIRDTEVMKQVLTFTEMGHLVFATMHTNSVEKTLEQVIHLFPNADQEQISLSLSTNLHSIITQNLLNHSSGEGKIVATEIMTTSSDIRSLIRKAKFSEVPQAMSRLSLNDGVVTMDDSIFELYEESEITYEEALQYVTSTSRFKTKLTSQSKRVLPEELQAHNHDWSIEDGDVEESVWGTFSKK